ncbi:ankyrin repeat-containing domain protein [Annulohypoxylon moriforme]|nr:ankyrin repeat-containing domain protein [Annulohypoxylon moriforme]
MENFNYDQLDLDRLSFRLVRLEKGTWDEIKCEIIQSTLNEEVIPYEAVSYRWGSSVKAKSIIVQGGRLGVTSNLYRILRDLRYRDEDRYLWIDAICINQEDVKERGHQVRRMKDIYSGAERVIFFLGRPTVYTNIFLAALAELQYKTQGNNWDSVDKRWDEAWVPIQTRLEEQFPDTRKIFYRALTYLMEQPWFRRVWILQEVCNARSAIVHCGRASISARVFAVTPRLLGIKLNPHHEAVFSLMPGPSRSQLRRSEDFFYLLTMFSGAEAQDERDKIYALLGMHTNLEGRELIPNYSSSVGEVIRDTILYVWKYDICFLPKEPYATMCHFLGDLEQLDKSVLIWLLEWGDVDGILYHIKRRGKYISMTDDIVKAILKNESFQEKIIEEFLQQRKNQVAIAIGTKNLLEWIKREGFDSMCGQFFLDDSKHINIRGSNGQTPLLIATKYGHASAVRLLICNGAYIEARDRDANTPLLLASRQGNLEVMQLLLSRGAYIGIEDKDGNTPLLLASIHGDMKIIRLLLSCGAEVNLNNDNKNTQRLSRLLHKYGETSLVGLSCGAYVGVRGVYGRVPLISAIRHANIEAVRLLLRHCSDAQTMIMTKDIYGKTPLIFAAELGTPEIVQLLLNYGSDVEARDPSGMTPLGIAVSYGSDTKVRILLDNGANTEAKDCFGRTPFLLAVTRSSSSIATIFLKKYSDLEAKEKRIKAVKDMKDIEARHSRYISPWNLKYADKFVTRRK